MRELRLDHGLQLGGMDRQDRLARRAAALAAVALPVVTAAAQGDESLFVPTGTVVGMFWVLVTAFVARTTIRIRALGIGVACLVASLPYLVPDRWMADWPGRFPRAAFMLGFAPPLAATAIVILVDRLRARRP